MLKIDCDRGGMGGMWPFWMYPGPSPDPGVAEPGSSERATPGLPSDGSNPGMYPESDSSGGGNDSGDDNDGEEEEVVVVVDIPREKLNGVKRVHRQKIIHFFPTNPQQMTHPEVVMVGDGPGPIFLTNNLTTRIKFSYPS